MYVRIFTAVIVQFSGDPEFEGYLRHQLNGECLTPGEYRWMLPIENEARTHDAAVAMLGTDGTRIDTVDIELVFDNGAGIHTHEGDLCLGPIQLFRTQRGDENIGAYLHDNVSITSGCVEFHHHWGRLVYSAPKADPGRIVVRNVARQRALRLQEQIRRGEIGYLQVNILDDSASQEAG